ncbi:MAG: UDP-N-acetyl glucosamine 2-epimerase, partial [Flavobacteriales bacterium]
MRRLLSIVGARPQFVKAAELHRALGERAAHRLLHTGQHYDTAMSRVFFEQLGIPEPEANLGIGGGAHGEQTSRMTQAIERELIARRPDAVVLYGDTNSTLAGALAAAKLQIPIAHVEAGMRSFRKAMPEEVNRVLCDHCSTWLFCPTQRAVANLLREGFSQEGAAPPSADRPRVLLTGDLMLDSALRHAAIAQERSDALQRLGLLPEGFLLATVHRDFNVDDAMRLRAILEALSSLAGETGLPVILPAHPRLRARLND